MFDSSIDIFLDICEQLAQKSNCIKRKFGAIVINEDRNIIGRGFNHIPYSSVDCGTDCIGDLRKGVKSGTCLEKCYAVHAEQMAILQAGRYSEGSDLMVVGIDPYNNFTKYENPKFYCTMCARLIVSANIRNVYLWNHGIFMKKPIEIWLDAYEGLK